jgi:hypothetical protein
MSGQWRVMGRYFGLVGVALSFAGLAGLAFLAAARVAQGQVRLGKPAEAPPWPMTVTGPGALPFEPVGAGPEAPPQKGKEDLGLYTPLVLGLPPAAELFRLDSEAMMQQRLRQEVKALQFPTAKGLLPKEGMAVLAQLQAPYSARFWPQSSEVVEPTYVCYRRLFFEQINPERYGWELGVLQPFLCAGAFYVDVALLPVRILEPFCYDADAGYCLPGDPVPLLLYPPWRK